MGDGAQVERFTVRDNRGAVALDRASLPFRDPRSLPANDNDPTGSVGPNVDAGFGDTHALYRPGEPVPMAWQGWPIGWGTASDQRSLFPRAFGKLSTVWSCVMANARPLSMLLPVVQRNSTPIPRSQWRTWVRNPHPGFYASWLDFMVSLMVSLQVRGEAFVVPAEWYADGYARWFHVAHPDALEPVDDLHDNGGRQPALFRWRDNSEPIPDVLHVRYATVAGEWRGKGPLAASASSEETAAALEQYAANLATRGGVPWGLLTNPVDLGAGAARTAQAQWVESSRSRLGAPAALTGGWDLKALTFSPKDMALLELREFDEQRIAAAFGVPPVLVGLSQPGSMNYSSTTMLADWHWRSTLQWMATNACRAVSNWALPGDQDLVLDSKAYTQPDIESRSRAYGTMADHGALSVDEWRTLENLGPLDADDGGADDLAAATNMQPTIG